jgi:hypothetical protein
MSLYLRIEALNKQSKEIFISSVAGSIPLKTFGNFRAPDAKRKNSPGGPDLLRIYKICSKNMRKFYDTSRVLNFT